MTDATYQPNDALKELVYRLRWHQQRGVMDFDLYLDSANAIEQLERRIERTNEQNKKIIAIADERGARIAKLEAAMEGVTQEMLNGGWNARSLSRYAKSLEDKISASPVASVPFLGESDMSALMTFHSQMEDHEADGYTVHKETMKRLAELGVVNSLGFGRYETTAFGAWLVEKAFEQDPTLPLRTVAEHNERSALLAASMGGDRT